MKLRAAALLGLVSLLAVGTACSSDDDPGPDAGSTAASTAVEATTTTIDPNVLRILVTNDDGYSSEGIDALVVALQGLPDVHITVVAPAENQSGKGDTTTEGIPVGATSGTTLSGFQATVVEGTPADSVNDALNRVLVDLPPHLVVSGSNQGQNLGVLTDVSGTIGAARTAARRGIPALAISQGLADQPDYAAGIDVALAWITEHRADIMSFSGPQAEVWSINAPTCAVGTPRGVLEIETATKGTGTEVRTDIDCTVTDDDPAHDVEAFNWGYITLSNVGLT